MYGPGFASGLALLCGPGQRAFPLWSRKGISAQHVLSQAPSQGLTNLHCSGWIIQGLWLEEEHSDPLSTNGQYSRKCAGENKK